MKKPKVIDLIKIDDYSITPKYIQIINSIIRNVADLNIKLGDNVPSINELSIVLDISRDTVERAYKHLKNMGVIEAVPRRGYYVKSTDLRQHLKIFLLFNKLSAHKKTIYDAFVETLGEQALIDFYIYNNDYLLFKRLIANKRDDYTHYVIIPHFMEGEENGFEIINTIPKEKLLLLDKYITGVTGEFAAVFENFEKDIYSALEEASTLLSSYHTLKIVFPTYSYYPIEILRGFKKFCQDYTFNYEVVQKIDSEIVLPGEVFICVQEDDLVVILEKLMGSGLQIGNEVGIISYNEIPIKKFILNGITTISTDFREMGIAAAHTILSGSKGHIEIPFKLTVRKSL